MQSEILEKIKNDNLKVFVVWALRYKGDNRDKILESMKLIRDDRVTHYMDCFRGVGTEYAQILKMPKTLNYAWDVYFAFDPNTEWKKSAPQPKHWMHQLRRHLGKDHPRLLDAPKLRKQIEALLKFKEAT